MDFRARRSKLQKRLGISADDLQKRFIAHMNRSGAIPRSRFERKLIEHCWLQELERKVEKEDA